jgi:dTDP-4-amino-4,6-dideoxygalactose transaminase
VVAAAPRRGRVGSKGRVRAVSRLQVMQPWLGDEEAAAAAEVIASGWVAQGPRVAAFEAAFAARQQSAYAVATSSCTAALHLALVVADVRPGDDVVVPSFSFIATANAPTYAGARPVFADVDPLTGNLTAAGVARALTPATTAVIVVDQGGVPVDLEGIRRLCDPRGITVVEDAACAAGSTYRDRPVGAGAEVAAWSFHPRKLLTTGEGGMLTTSRPDWASRAAALREHAMDLPAAERHRSVLAPAEHYTEVGFNYRMTDLQAAVGLVQLGKLDEMVARRRELAAVYAKHLAEIDGLRAVTDPAWGTTNFQSHWVEVEPEYPLTRDELLVALAEHEISARRGIMAAHREPAYAGRAHRPLPATDRLTENTLILPLFHTMTDEQLDRVVDVLRTGRC